MEEVLTKEIVQKLMEIQGEARGTSLKSDGEFILKEEGQKGLARLEKRLNDFGFSIRYKEIRPMDFYPVGLRGIELLAIKELFGFDKEKFRQMGAFQTKISLIVKLFMKFFVSLEMLAKQGPKIWRKYYTTGDFEVIEIDSKKKKVILRLKNFVLHPLHCTLLEGYFGNMIKMVVNVPVDCKETKCPFKGDEYHEFLLRW